MEDLFNEIQTAIAENMPSVSLVDEDYGQLQTEEDHYPVTFPAVLINMEGVAWETITDEYQRGTIHHHDKTLPGLLRRYTLYERGGG